LEVASAFDGDFDAERFAGAVAGIVGVGRVGAVVALFRESTEKHTTHL